MPLIRYGMRALLGALLITTVPAQAADDSKVRGPTRWKKAPGRSVRAR
jgi:hypothetical protein